MAALWTRINTFLLILLVLMAGGTMAILATRAESGPLDPVGTPGPTLPQVEPRKPIPPVGWNGTFPVQITEPGSYFLTRNLVGVDGVDGISISSTDVVLDLNGFRLERSGPTPSEGIVVTASATGGTVVIQNGTLRSWSTGIDASAATGVRVSDIGISFSPQGILATAGGATIEDCTVSNSGGIGITVTAGVVRRCTIFGNQQVGIRPQGNATIEDNLVFDNGAGPHLTRSNIYVEGQYNLVRDNHIMTPEGGAPVLRITGTNNIIVRNFTRCIIVDGGGNFRPGALDYVDTNYCY